MITIINFYFLPAIFSVMAFLSLSSFLKKRNALLKIIISFAVACLAVFVYFFTHSVFDGVSITQALFSFGFNDFIASFLICILNTVILWVLINLK
ncbi:hypothetical protein JMY81_13070 [Brenneria goodwinii]|uniref:hypothetical protein n=1 Tax=Brenneria goodwinii TaxID=1109412 RepID=UPI000BAE8E4A|nr:hypothetical protein [Brenneria goodwinii]ATA26494.1 hypothetical protein AWC36_21630 [Brenneria goodwinii]MCG8157800.1 hypothetical protein [Brenneria goodwinii]MCG8161747.1 hypothetical protein [Brenneria goodwinii]MCG8166619.1 hypothetical protein [Brenneria goodwinii]MCG8171423.1 hypothetical protein [Brenneria goodwinii]